MRYLWDLIFHLPPLTATRQSCRLVMLMANISSIKGAIPRNAKHGVLCWLSPLYVPDDARDFTFEDGVYVAAIPSKNNRFDLAALTAVDEKPAESQLRRLFPFHLTRCYWAIWMKK